MPDREKVIKGLECCTAFDGKGFPLCEECPYEDEGTCPELDVLHKDALELLKAQEPRVMTLEEVIGHYKKYRIKSKVKEIEGDFK